MGKLGGHRTLDAAARRDLRRLAGGEEGRLGALLELWDGSGHLVNLPAPLLEAFGAPAIPDAGEAAPDTEAQDLGGVGVADPVIDQRSREEKELEAWAKGGGLDKAVDKLRPLLFDAIADAIDWDDIGLERTRFCGTEEARPFRRRSITFTRQGTRGVTSLVMLEIPGAAASAAEFDKVAIALSGLVRAEREGHWDFSGGSDGLATFLQCLDGWRSEVIGQLQKLTEAREGWDHAGAAAELLAIGNVINGRLKADADQIADVAALLAPEWPTEVAPGSTEMKRLYDALAQRQPEFARCCARSAPGPRAARSARWSIPASPSAPCADFVRTAGGSSRPRPTSTSSHSSGARISTRGQPTRSGQPRRRNAPPDWLGSTRWKLPSGPRPSARLLLPSSPHYARLWRCRPCRNRRKKAG